jgi:putative PIN family toxin of toxin-antitoxin system
MKVIFDTNVYVSESLVGGLAEQIIAATIAARWRIFASGYLLDEAERVLNEKLGLGARIASLAHVRIRRRCEPIVEPPPSRHQVPADAGDGPILRAAVAAGIDLLVTNDRHLLALSPYEGIRILTMQDYAQLLRAEGLLEDILA